MYLWPNAREKALWIWTPPLTLLEHLKSSQPIASGSDGNALSQGIDSVAAKSTTTGSSAVT